MSERVYGIDFSASKRDAGRKTWIAEARREDDGLHLEELADAATMLECSPKRDSTLEALVGFLNDFDGEAVGLDFPFGLPATLLEEADSWRDFIDGVRNGEWGRLGEISGPTEFHEQAKIYSEENDEELRRDTDDERDGQSPTGFRIRTQTFYGISRVLAKLGEGVAIPPMDDVNNASRCIVETYPAAVFRHLSDASDEGYKRDTRNAIDNRRENICALGDEGVKFGDYKRYAVASDNALDAVAAAYATSENLDGFGADEANEREGYIFV